MDIRKLQRAIVDGLEDVKAQHIAVFNTEHLSAMFERVIIASGTSNRQTRALAASVRDSVKQRGMQVLRTEGEDNGEWIIVDCGAAVAHIMQPAIREYYHLEEIWGGKAVKMKVGVDAPAKAGGARAAAKAPAKTVAKTAAKTATKTADKAVAKSAGKTAAKTAAKPATARPRAAPRKAASSPAKSTAAAPRKATRRA